MSILDVTEYDELAFAGKGGQIMAGQEPSRLNQQLAVGGASAVSAAFDSVTRFIRVHTDVPCRIAIGTNPTAGPASMRMAASQTEYLGVRPGLKIAVISTT